MSKIRFSVGLDVHKDSIAIGYADAEDLQASPRFLGTTPYSLVSLTKALTKIGGADELRLCYEAGPCGYGLVRELTKRGYDCQVIAPSRVARQPADRVKTDRRDALLLARLHRAGELTPITVPNPQDEAIRDLVRTRADWASELQRSRQRLRAFLLRQGMSYKGRRWGPKHALYLSKIKFEDPVHHTVFTEYRLAVRDATERVRRIEEALRQQTADWRWLPVVKALMTLRSIDFLSALIVVAELGDLRRFPHPRDLMGYLGLVPSEYSTGGRQRRGGITKTGNTHVRRVLIEAAWNYRFAARIGESLQPRLEGQPKTIVDLAWNAQLRLCHRYQRLRRRGLHQNKVCTAIARELSGFIWDIARRIDVQPASP
jgi:transposase